MIILASASPRRQELLSLICEDFEILPADIDESITEDVKLLKTPEYLAVKKAGHIHNNGHFDDVVIGCDTGVFTDNLMLGKPKDESDAFEMLSMLSNKAHKVITGCAVFYKDKMISFSQVTEVEFYKLTDDEIKEYVRTGEPMDKAGAYGIQGKGTVLVKGIKGDYFNVVGLPVAKLNKMLKELGAI